MIEQVEDLKYFKIPLKSLVDGRPRAFPLYIHLVLNDRMLLCCTEGKILPVEELHAHEGNGLVNFWCPTSYLAAWEAYLAQGAENSLLYLSKNDASFRAELEEEARELIGELANQSDSAPEKLKNTLNRCKEFNKKMLRRSLQKLKMSSIYQELLILNKADGEHSFLVSAFSVIFGLAAGYAIEAPEGVGNLGDLALGGLTHDIGLLKLSPELLRKPQIKYTDEEREELTEHVERGLEILARAKVPISPTVLAIIEQHHENYDGSGYPNRKIGKEINTCAQIVAFADQIVDLITGQTDGRTWPPKEALQHMIEIQGKNRAICRFEPALFSKLITFIRQASVAHMSKASGEESQNALSA